MAMRTYYILEEEGKGVIFEDTGLDEAYTKVNNAEELKKFTETVISVVNRMKKDGELSRTQAFMAKKTIKDTLNDIEETKEEKEFDQEEREDSFLNKQNEREKELLEKEDIVEGIMNDIQRQRKEEEAKRQTGPILNEFDIQILHKYDSVCPDAAVSWIMAEMDSTDIDAAKAVLMTALGKRKERNAHKV